MENLSAAWTCFLQAQKWNELIQGTEPKATGCGPVYELPNSLNRPHESFAIADMRGVLFTEPHYHLIETEIYFILEGKGIVVVNKKEHKVQKGSVVVIPPDTAHFTISKGIVLAAVNTPPFKIENYIPLKEDNPTVGFDRKQYEAYLISCN